MIRDGVFKTGDMALAAVLTLEGHRATLELKPGSRSRFVWWCFADAEQLETLLEQYEDGECLVEPRKFFVAAKRVREELFDFLKVDRDSRRIDERLRQ